MTGRKEEEQAEDVNVPHPIHHDHEATGELQHLGGVLVPLIGALHQSLTDGEPNEVDGGGQQQELNPSLQKSSTDNVAAEKEQDQKSTRSERLFLNLTEF